MKRRGTFELITSLIPVLLAIVIALWLMWPTSANGAAPRTVVFVTQDGQPVQQIGPCDTVPGELLLTGTRPLLAVELDCTRIFRDGFEQ
jgi:hypothetical protein